MTLVMSQTNLNFPQKHLLELVLFKVMLLILSLADFCRFSPLALMIRTAIMLRIESSIQFRQYVLMLNAILQLHTDFYLSGQSNKSLRWLRVSTNCSHHFMQVLADFFMLTTVDKDCTLPINLDTSIAHLVELDANWHYACLSQFSPHQAIIYRS